MLLGPNLSVEKHKSSIIKYFNEAKSFYEDVKEVFVKQTEILPNLEELSHRYRKIKDYEKEFSYFPFDVVEHVKQATFSEWHSFYSKLRYDLEQMNVKLEALQGSYKSFEGKIKTQSRDVEGFDPEKFEIWRCLSFYIDNLNDILNYFTRTLAKVSCYLTLMRTDDVDSVKDYLDSIKEDKEFNKHFNFFLFHIKVLENSIKGK